LRVAATVSELESVADRTPAGRGGPARVVTSASDELKEHTVFGRIASGNILDDNGRSRDGRPTLIGRHVGWNNCYNRRCRSIKRNSHPALLTCLLELAEEEQTN
jgi:hypothetical protein